ncbi:MAG: hypothetical protein ACLGH5_04750 [Actinomycetes bacterium]
MRAPTVTLAAIALVLLTSCASSPARCAGSFDAEVIPSADGEPTKVEAVERWAASHPAPDAGWVETPTGASAGDWRVTTVQVDDGGWIVESMRCGGG